MPKKIPKKIVFIANKTVKEPTIVHFNTKNGAITFTAKKGVKKPQVVSFDVPSYKKRK